MATLYSIDYNEAMEDIYVAGIIPPRKPTIIIIKNPASD